MIVPPARVNCPREASKSMTTLPAVTGVVLKSTMLASADLRLISTETAFSTRLIPSIPVKEAPSALAFRATHFWVAFERIANPKSTPVRVIPSRLAISFPFVPRKPLAPAAPTTSASTTVSTTSLLSTQPEGRTLTCALLFFSKVKVPLNDRKSKMEMVTVPLT